VPWAGAGHTVGFDARAAWSARKMSKSAVTSLMRTAWRTGGVIIERTWREVEDCHDRFENLTRIGIDEISYKKGHKYLTIAVDQVTGRLRLLWAGIGRESQTVNEFFDLLGPERRNQITLVSADAARRIARAVAVLRRPLPDPRIHPPRQEHQTTPCQHRCHPRTRPVQRPDRIHQHEDPPHHPHGFRLRQHPIPHRPRHTQPRRLHTHPPQPKLTDRYNRNADFLLRSGGGGGEFGEVERL